MASPTRWTWVWVNSGSWWWTGRPGVLRFMGLQRVGHDWATELNWMTNDIEYLFMCRGDNYIYTHIYRWVEKCVFKSLKVHFKIGFFLLLCLRRFLKDIFWMYVWFADMWFANISSCKLSFHTFDSFLKSCNVFFLFWWRLMYLFLLSGFCLWCHMSNVPVIVYFILFNQ